MKIQTIVVGDLLTNCYVLYDEQTREASVIDPGGDADALLMFISNNRLSVKNIFLTHGHFDHMLAAAPLREKTAARIVVHADDAQCLSDGNTALYLSVTSEPFRSVKPDVLLHGGEKTVICGIEAEILHTPGHSPGSICLLMDNMLFTGDTIFQDDCGRTDLPRGSLPVLMRSLRMLYNLEYDHIIYPGHGEPSTLGMEKINNYQFKSSANVK